MNKLFRYMGKGCIVALWLVVIAGVLMLASGYYIFQPGKSITIFAWGDMLDEDVIAEFEQQTGITVNVSFYATNEELLAKLRALEGRGYDLVVPSDYVVAKLIQEGLVQPLDKERLHFYNDINPVLLGHFFDPENRYALPFEWELYGIGMNAYCQPREEVEQHPWRCIFEPYKTFLAERFHAIAMANDPVEAIVFAAHYLYGPVTSLSREQQREITQLLQKQKAWVEAYTNDRSEYYLATNNCCISLSQSSLIWRAMRQYGNISFYLPPNDGFVTIEHCAIPVGSDKQDLVYQFLDHLYSRESMRRHFEKHAFIPARYDVIDQLSATEEQKQIMRSSHKRFRQLHFIRDLVPDEIKNRMWIEIKQ